jgi:serine/threonine-protein kinase
VLLADTADGATEPPMVDPSSPEMPPAAGRPVRVQLLGEIARGGMGVVLKGRDPNLGRDLAVKVLLESHKEKPDLVRRFVEEAQIGGQLQHPGVVPVYELGTFADGRPYFTTKLVKGRTLAELLADRESATDDLPRFLGIFEQVCQTMAYAHARDVIHRDLKPSNVMVGSFGEVQVMDWGLAKVLPKGGVIDDATAGKVAVHKTVIATARVLADSDLSQAGSVMGTPAYMALESHRTAEAAEARARAERQSRRLTGALAASVLGLVLVSGGGFGWFLSQRALRQARVDLALREAEVLRNQAAQAGDDLSRWAKAGDAAHAVERLMADARDEATRHRLAVLVKAVTSAAAAAAADRKLLDELIDIRSAEADDRDGSATDANYTVAFREAGLDVTALPPAEAGAKIRARPATVAVTLAAALDDWAAVRRELQRDRPGAEKLAQVARAADSDRWRDGLRTALDFADKSKRLDALRALAGAAKIDDLAPVSLNLLGSALRDAGDPQAAEGVLRQAQRRYPGDVWLNYNLAACLEKLARREEAIRYYTAARSIRPETAHELAHALQYKGELGEATAVFRDLERLRPNNGRHLVCLAQLLKSQGRSKEAAGVLEATVAMLREASRIRPDDFLIHTDLGRALDEQGKPEEAIAEYQTARRLRPDHARTLMNLSSALAKQGKLEEAIALCREAIEVMPDAGMHNSLAGALRKQGKLEEAIAEYRTAVRLQPDTHQYHENLGLALEQRGMLEEASAEYRTAIRIDPACANAHRNLGDALTGQGKLEEAIAECNEVIRLKPDDAGAHDTLGNALTSQGKLAEAMVEYRNAFRLKPDAAPAHNGLAWNLVLSPDRPRRDYDLALEHARKAVELAPKERYYVNTLALAEYRAGHWNESIAASERSMAVRNGENASDWFFLALAHWRKGEKDEARRWFDKAVVWTKEKDPKNVELRQFWKEAAELLGVRGPDAPGENSAGAPKVEKRR